MLEQYLHDHIPLSLAMGVKVVSASDDEVTLSAPLEPNINHRDTVFGGSASAVAILAAWSLIYVRLQQEGMNSRVVIQRNSMSYIRPIAGKFTATSVIQNSEAWEKFLKVLKRKSRARISVGAILRYNGEEVARLEGDFVALGKQAIE